ncbi:hypothetical protein DAEQUDRAFT_740110 [Daedalea quercina L-15889]|uniref:DUF6533 domain-containing protein n=1 Tax=Daedalea quercina L-15889 TaxID=1314783 RepID=A0A165MX99_9APHY|nr:hypothetical protein DAEQUDRAFT_740110 [Daedalea quercina L-15889]
MSQVDGTSNEAALAAALNQDMLLANFCSIAATTLLFYDYTLTFSREVRCIWRRKFSLATVLFLLNRYLFIVYRILMTVEMFPLAQNPMAGQALYGSASHYPGVINSDNDSDRSFYGIAHFYYTKVSFIMVAPPLVGCADAVNMTEAASDIYNQINLIHGRLGYFNCAFAISTDAIVLILTCLKTKQCVAGLRVNAKDDLKGLGQNNMFTYVSLIQRDGTVYFLALLALNVVDLIAIKNQVFGSLPALAEVLTSVLVSRFLLNLREIYLSSQEVDSTRDDLILDTHASALGFRAHSVAGNLGAPLEDMIFDPEAYHDCEPHVAEDIAYVSADPLAMGLHSFTGTQEDYGTSTGDGRLRPLKELYDIPV